MDGGPSQEDMIRAITEKASADLAFTLAESGVLVKHQFGLIELGFNNLRKFSGLEDDRIRVRAALAKDLGLDVEAGAPAGPEARLALASLVTAWEVAKERVGRESQLRTEAKVNGVPRMLDILDRTAMKRAVEGRWGPIPVHESPSPDYISHKVQEIEDNEPTASPLDEVSSANDTELATTVTGWDASGKSQLFRKRMKGSLPQTPEGLRTRLRIERNTWLFLASKFTNRAWLHNLLPSIFEIYTDYFLGKKVHLLEVCGADGTKHELRPPWAIVLNYELECRKAAIRAVVEKGTHLAQALEEAIHDPELKELAFTGPVAYLGRQNRQGAKPEKQQADQSKRTDPYHTKSKTKGRGKGHGDQKGKGKGKGKLLSNTPDGRQICFAFNNESGCTTKDCPRVHICRVKGCMGTHPMQQCNH